MQFGHLDTDETKSHKSCLTEDITTQNFSIKGFQTEDGNLGIRSSINSKNDISDLTEPQLPVIDTSKENSFGNNFENSRSENDIL